MMEENMSKVYVLTDETSRILRCEGGYTTPSDLTGWAQIDEGTGDKYNLCQNHYFEGGLYTHDGIPRYKLVDGQPVERTEEEIAADRVPLRASAARAQRDKLLAATDWTQTLDAPIDADTREAMRTYRQALRDVPQQDGFPTDVQWPELPETVKARPDPVDTAFDVLIGGDSNA